MKRVSIIGMGMGHGDLLTQQALAELSSAELVIGSRRLIEDFAGLYHCQSHCCYKSEEIAEIIHMSDRRNICVLMSGDVGFYSGAKKLYTLLDDVELDTICGITSVQYFAAKLCRSWQCMHLVSAHGVSCNAVLEVMNNSETFFLTGGDLSPADICRQLTDAGMDYVNVTIGERLSFLDEQIVSGPPKDFLGKSFDVLSVVLVDNPRPIVNSFVTHGLCDSEFIRGDAPMTKQEIRSIALSKLKIRRNDILYDIGAGTGSVAVEMALQANCGKVFAIEKNEAAFELILKNRERHNAHNLVAISGESPQALLDLPAPQAAFIGGSGKNLAEIIAILIEKNPSIRLVVTAVTLETLSLAVAEFDRLSFCNVDIVQISVNHAEKVGAYRMMKAQNPVYIISGRGRGNE